MKELYKSQGYSSSSGTKIEWDWDKFDPQRQQQVSSTAKGEGLSGIDGGGGAGAGTTGGDNLVAAPEVVNDNVLGGASDIDRIRVRSIYLLVRHTLVVSSDLSRVFMSTTGSIHARYIITA